MAPSNKCFLVMFMPYALFPVPTGGFISFTKLHLQRISVSSAFHRKTLFIASWDRSGGTVHAIAPFFMQRWQVIGKDWLWELIQMRDSHQNFNLLNEVRFQLRAGDGNEWNWPYEMTENDILENRMIICACECSERSHSWESQALDFDLTLPTLGI